MSAVQLRPELIDLPESPGLRFLVAAGRGLLLHCPYCGHGDIFNNWLLMTSAPPAASPTHTRTATGSTR